MTRTSSQGVCERDAITRSGRGGVRVYPHLDELPRSCQELMARPDQESLYGTLAWYRNLTEHALDPDAEPRFYALEEEAGAGGLAVLPMYRPGRTAGLRERRGLVSLSTYYSSLYAPILAAPAEASGGSIHRLVARICRERPAWDFVRLSPLAVEHPSFLQLTAAFKDCGFVVQPYFCFGNWYLEVAGRSSQEYFASLSSQLRNTIRRKRRKLGASGPTAVRIITERDDLDQAIADYEKIYASSWKTAEPYPEFVPGLIRNCAAMGWLRLGLLYVEGQPVAAQVWIVNGRTAAIYKLAYDEKHAALSPGTILTAHLMEHVIDVDRVEMVDYLTGDDAYKRDWMSHRRERWGLLALNPRTFGGLISVARHVGGRLLKRLAVSARTRP